MAHSQPLYLPQELVDCIIDALDEEQDKTTLESCTLVSRAWSARSYGILRHTIHINEDSLQSSSLFRTLLSANPRLRASIHVLSIRSTSGIFRVSPERLISLFDGLESLHTIKMNGVECKPIDREIRQWSRTAPLQHLELRGLRANTSECFVATVGFFAKVSVQRFSMASGEVGGWLQGVAVEIEREELQPEHAALFNGWQVGEVELGTDTASIMLDILGAGRVQHLWSLTLPQIYSQAMLVRIPRLARAVGPYVMYLRLNIARPCREYDSQELTDIWGSISHFTSLEALELDWNFTGSQLPGPVDTLYCDHIDIIKHVAPTLTDIVFRFNLTALTHWRRTALIESSSTQALESKLLSLPNLQSLTVTLCTSYVNSGSFGRLVCVDTPVPCDEAKMIRDALGTLYKAGKLHLNVEVGLQKLYLT